MTDDSEGRPGPVPEAARTPSRQEAFVAPDLLYALNDRPPWGRTLLYGVQWLIIFLPMIAVVSVLAADVLGLSPMAKVDFFQRLLIVTGLTMIAQTLWGHQLPLLDGPAMALIITLATLAPAGRPVIGGGMIFGGLLIMILGLFRLTRHIVPLFTDRVIGVILLLIGLTILPYLANMLMGVDAAHPNGNPAVAALAVLLTLLMVALFHYLKGLAGSLSIFIGVVLGVAVFAALGRFDLTGVRHAPWLDWPRPDWGPGLRFDPAGALSFALAYLAVLVNATGSLFSVEPIVQADHMDRRLDRGLALTGLSGVFAGAAGVVGTVSYSISPGVITVTRVGSRFALTAAGLLILALAFFGKLAAIMSAVPGPVVAAALLASMSAGVGVSIDIIHRGKERLTNRDYLIVGLPTLMGAMAAILPHAFLDLLPAAIRPLAGNGLIVGVVLVLLLEHVLLAKRKKDGR
ncbi:MAG: purine/pyrimidine permease [Proteobacteria bacterium]|nr:purine/pyrimidine permease [Pseudomonadota bacterium]